MNIILPKDFDATAYWRGEPQPNTELKQPEITRPQVQDVTRYNTREFLYLRGSTAETAQNGDMRIQIINGNTFHLEVLELDVWVDAPIKTALGSIEFGWDMALGAAGGWLQTVSRSEGTGAKRLIPHIHYNDNGSFGLHAPSLNEKGFDEDWQWIFDGESAPFTDASNTFPIDENALISKLYFKCGSNVPAPTDLTEVSIYEGSVVDEDSLYFRKRFIGSHWIADTEISLDLGGEVQIIYDRHRANNDITMRIQSFGDPLSLLIRESNQLWWLGLDVQRFKAEQIQQENQVLDNDFNPIMYPRTRDPQYAQEYDYLITGPFQGKRGA